MAAEKAGVSMYFQRIQVITASSSTTTTNARMVAVRKCGIRYGRVWKTPPRVVITPQIVPRIHGAPRPVSEPLSDKPSAMPIEMPAPTEAAMPTRKVSQELPVAKAAAKSGARVETEPSISPTSPGWT